MEEESNIHCAICSRLLVIGLGEETEKEWCPNCEGFNVISKSKASRMLMDDHDEKLNKIFDICKDYSKDSIIGSLISYREGDLISQKNSHTFSLKSFFELSYIINKIVEKENCFFQNKTISAKSEDFQRVLYYANDIVFRFKCSDFLNKGICLLVEIPSEKIKKYTVNYKLNLQAGKIKQEYVNNNQIKFTKKWKHNLKNFEIFGLIPEISPVSETGDEKRKLSILTESVKIKLAFQMNGDEIFPDIKFNKNQIFPLKQLFMNMSDSVDFFQDNKNNGFMCRISPLSIDSLFMILTSDSNSNIFLKNFLFDENNSQGFPLIYVSHLRQGVYVPPHSCFLVYKYLHARDVIDIEQLNADAGKEFETHILTKLQGIKIKTNFPNNPHKKMKNITDDPDEPTLEIDLIGYNENTIWVIDCKHFLLNDSSLYGKRKKRISRKLNEMDINNKQLKRIDYVKDNLLGWGFDPNKINCFKSVVVTLLNEQIQRIGETYVVSEQKLSELHNLP